MTASRRIATVEAVKGLAIVLVVYGHVAQGLQHRGWWDSSAYFLQERVIYSFHMAAFFFVSGLFVSGSIAKLGPGEFVLQRARTVLWPYLVCAATGIAEFLFGPNSAPTLHGFVHSFLVSVLTGEASWFLPTLFLCLILALLIDRIPLWARFAIAAGLSLFLPSSGIRVLDSVAHYFVFLIAGEFVNRRIERIDTIPRWPALAAAAASLSLVVLGSLSELFSTRIIVLLLGLVGTLALFLLARAMNDSILDRAAQWCGAASLGIFVLHPFCQGVTRLVLARITTSHAILPNLLVPAIVAIVVPGLLWHHRQRMHIGFLFAFPWGAQKQAVPRSEAALVRPVSIG